MPRTRPTAAHWHAAFEAWRQHQRMAGRLRRASSEAVYRAMWQAVAAWALARQPALAPRDLQEADLQAYLASRHGLPDADGPLSARYQQRLRSLVQRIQDHLVWQRHQQLSAPGAASASAGGPERLRRPAVADGPSAGTPPLHLLPHQGAALQALLCHLATAPGRWQDQRDRCAAALQLGGGLGPGELRALRLTSVLAGGPAPAASWRLAVPASGDAPAHAAPLADWAAEVLAAWLARRQQAGLAGPWLLPSTRSGKPWGKVAQYEAARRVLADAGVPADAAGGSFRLRHSFALRQLQQGVPADTLAGWLGIQDPAVMLRYQQALGPPAGDTGSPPSAPVSGGWRPA